MATYVWPPSKEERGGSSLFFKEIRFRSSGLQTESVLRSGGVNRDSSLVAIERQRASADLPINIELAQRAGCGHGQPTARGFGRNRLVLTNIKIGDPKSGGLYRKKNRPQFADDMFERINELDQEFQVLKKVLASLRTSEPPLKADSP